MTALALLVALTLSIFTVPLSVDAQGSAKVYRIGMLRPGSPLAGSSPNLEAFHQGMHDLGYIDGQHFVVESRWAEGSDQRLHDLAAELVRLQVDVIMAAGALATHAAQQATRTMPKPQGCPGAGAYLSSNAPLPGRRGDSMTALILIVIFTLDLLMAPLAANAQPARKMPRIDVLAPDTPAGPWVDAFRQGLRDIGYVEDQTITLDIHWDEGKRAGAAEGGRAQALPRGCPVGCGADRLCFDVICVD